MKVKILELLLFLDALELSAGVDGRGNGKPYFYKAQVEKVKAVGQFITQNMGGELYAGGIVGAVRHPADNDETVLQGGVRRANRQLSDAVPDEPGGGLFKDETGNERGGDCRARGV